MTSDCGGAGDLVLVSLLIFLMVSDTDANVSAVVIDMAAEDSEDVLMRDSEEGDLDGLEK